MAHRGESPLETPRGEHGHLCDRVRERQGMGVADVMAQHTSEGAGTPWMAMSILHPCIARDDRQRTRNGGRHDVFGNHVHNDDAVLIAVLRERCSR
jgi:hypothetical protein